MKKLLDFDWLRAVQFKCNTSANYKKSKIFKTNEKPNHEPLWIKKEERIREKKKEHTWQNQTARSGENERAENFF